MPQQNINVGTSEGKGDGDSLRTAFQKINNNFTELYSPDNRRGYTGSSGPLGFTGYVGSVGASAVSATTDFGTFSNPSGYFLQVRKGGTIERRSVLPLQGELLYSTDTKKLYVGDGITYGGNLVSGATGYTGSSGTATGLTNVSSHILPSLNLTYDLGSTSSQWRSLYVGTDTIYIGGSSLSIINGQLRVSGNSISATTSTLINGTSTVALSTTGTTVLPGPLRFADGTIQTTAGGSGVLGTTSTLANGTYTVSLSNVGLTQFPAVSGKSLFIQGGEIGSANGSIAISTRDDVIITTDILGSSKQWRFYQDGNLKLSSNLSIFPLDNYTPYYGTVMIQKPDQQLIMVSSGTYAQTQLGWAESIFSAGSVAMIGFNETGSGNVEIVTGSFTETVNTWIFDKTGILTLVNGTSTIKTEAFSNFGTDFPSIVLTPDPTFDQGQGLRIYAGFSEAGHLHLTASTSTTDLFLGNDNQYVKLAADGMIELNGNTVRLWGEGIMTSNAHMNLPNNNDSDSVATMISNYGLGGVQIEAGNPVKAWLFSSTGTLIFPDNSIQSTSYISNAEQKFDIKNSNFNVNVNRRYGVSTTASTVTATLPASPSLGDAIFFADAGGNFASNNFTIARNGNTIMGASSDTVISTNGDSIGLFWNGTTWRYYE